MPWNYIKCENYGSFAARRNRETTEPEIFMLPTLLKDFLIIFLHHTIGFSSCKWLVWGHVETKSHPCAVGSYGAGGYFPFLSSWVGFLSLEIVIKCWGRATVSRAEQAASFIASGVIFCW